VRPASDRLEREHKVSEFEFVPEESVDAIDIRDDEEERITVTPGYCNWGDPEKHPYPGDPAIQVKVLKRNDAGGWFYDRSSSSVIPMGFMPDITYVAGQFFQHVYHRPAPVV
jgi:hypothetical protein